MIYNITKLNNNGVYMKKYIFITFFYLTSFGALNAYSDKVMESMKQWEKKFNDNWDRTQERMYQQEVLRRLK